MLGIAPVSVNNKFKNPSFKSLEKDDVDKDIRFYKDQVDELDKFMNEGYVPDKMKKPFKFFRTIANGAIDGLAVFGSTMMLASCIKKSTSKIGANKYVNKAANVIKPVFEKIPQLFTTIGEKISKGLDNVVKTSLYQKFASTKLGKRLIVDTSIAAVKAEELALKAKKPFENITFNGDKATKATATVLGIGSGVTGAYETTIKDEVPNEEIEELRESA